MSLYPSDDQPEFKCLHSVWQRQRQSDDDDGIVRACSLTSAPTIYVFSPTGHPCKERLILTARTCKKYTMKKSPSNPCRRIYITPFNFFFLEHMKWVGSSKLVSFPQEIFFLQKNNFSAFLQVDIYIPIGRRHNGGLAHYYRKSMEWSGESSPLGQLLMHHLSPNIYSSQNRQNGYIFTRDYCNSNGSSGSRCTQIVGYHYFDHHQPSRGSLVRLL